MRQTVQQWLMMLNPREKIMVFGGLAIAILILFWGLVWEPLQSERVKLETQIEERENELRWMRMAQTRIKQSDALASRNIPVPARNPSRVIEQALQKHDLKKGLNQMRGNDQVKVSLKDVEADKVMSFLGELETSYGLTISNLEIIPLNEKGKVNANLQLGN